MIERTAASVVLALVLFSVAALGQAGQRPPDKPASPASLPGDTLPPFGMLDSSGTLVPQPTRPAGGAARGNAPAQRRGPVNTRGPEMALAIEAALAAVESCETQGFYIGASVIDTSGQPRAMVESNGWARGSEVRGQRSGFLQNPQPWHPGPLNSGLRPPASDL
jgi:hypothetical protein